MEGAVPTRPAWFPEKRVTVFTGDFGSGKTEVAVNYSLALAELERGVRIADLDLIKPYFRSREALALLEGRGIEVITPRGEHLTSELPILLPEVKGLLQSRVGLAVLDVGGHDLGARVLSSLHGSWLPEDVEMLLVVNANRPFTDTVDGVLRVLGKIEDAARMPVTGLVANTHLMEQTTPEIVYRGVELAQEAAVRQGIPVRAVTACHDIARLLDPTRLPAPLFPLTRIIVPPWTPREKLGKDNFRL